jgi:hypothetical protein
MAPLCFRQYLQVGGAKLDFQVNDQTYFLSLAEDKRSWLVFASTPDGALPIPVYVDAPDMETPLVLQEEKHRIPN